MTNHFKKTTILAAALAFGAFSLTACSASAVPETIKVQNVANQVITVQSDEVVKAQPDMAEITFAVYTQAADPKECQEQNQKDLDSALSVLESAGIEKTSIQTSGYGLEPVYDWNSGRTVTGYEMTTIITVSDLAIDQVGSLLTQCVDAGVNQIQSVDYLCSTYDASYQEALQKAIESAKVKGQAIAAASGATLGNVVTVQETPTYQTARYNGYQKAAAMESGAADMGAMSVEPGQIEIEARITVEFEIKY